jgi:hypothetical protein
MTNSKYQPHTNVCLVGTWGNRVILKVRKTQHQNPEFGHTQGEIQKKNSKKVHQHSTGDETQKTINFGGKLSFIVSFLFPERRHCCYIYFKPRALNAEFQHFIVSCSVSYWDSIKCLHFVDTSERGDRGWKEAQRQGYFTDIRYILVRYQSKISLGP